MNATVLLFFLFLILSLWNLFFNLIADEQNEVHLCKNQIKPLDLSRNSMKNKQRLDVNGDKLQQPMIVPKRRNYSKEELDKAIIDIQSGRIGTRRASVLYGIPRSTLRNKVFRLTNNKLPRNATCKPSMNGFNKEKLLNELCLKMIVEKLTKKNGLLPSTSMHVEPTQLVTDAANTSAFVQFNLNKVMFKLLDDLLSQKTSPVSASSPSFKMQTEVKSNVLKHSTIPLTQTGINDHNGKADNHDNVNKQKRAKRGQYRRYELGQLNKAVDAVLNGSMSVHKAGSHFGVPHSTLEYKVKEKTLKNLDLKVSLSL
jgi:hypothetical protein